MDGPIIWLVTPPTQYSAAQLVTWNQVALLPAALAFLRLGHVPEHEIVSVWAFFSWPRTPRLGETQKNMLAKLAISGSPSYTLPLMPPDHSSAMKALVLARTSLLLVGMALAAQIWWGLVLLWVGRDDG